MFSPLYVLQPREVSIETLALCNAACEFCPYPTLSRKGTVLDTALVYALFDQMKTWVAPFTISPFKVNEPLLDDRLENFCRYVDREIPNASLRLFTNGSPLIDANVEWISRLSRVEHLWVSLNEVDPDRYRAVMHLDFKRTALRLDALHAWKACGKFPHRVVLSRVTDLKDSIEDQKFSDYCFTRWPRFAVTRIKRDAWIDFTRATHDQVPPTPCGRWWELSICADANVALCCMDGAGDYSLGNVRYTPLLDIYNQPQLVSRRRYAMSRRGIDPCERCTY